MFVIRNEVVHYDKNCRQSSLILSTKCNDKFRQRGEIDFEIDHPATPSPSSIYSAASWREKKPFRRCSPYGKILSVYSPRAREC